MGAFRTLAVRDLASGPVPGGAVTCKFVLLSHGDSLYLAYAPVEQCRYHAQVLERFCRAEGIPALWNQRPERLELYDREWRIHGGGWLRLDRAAGTVRLYGRSSVYGPFERSLVSGRLGEIRAALGLEPVVDRER